MVVVALLCVFYASMGKILKLTGVFFFFFLACRHLILWSTLDSYLLLEAPYKHLLAQHRLYFKFWTQESKCPQNWLQSRETALLLKCVLPSSALIPKLDEKRWHTHTRLATSPFRSYCSYVSCLCVQRNSNKLPENLCVFYWNKEIRNHIIDLLFSLATLKCF